MRYAAIAVLCLTVAAPGFAESAASEEPTAYDESGPIFTAFDQIANHYKCYQVVPLFSQQLPTVRLRDQFKQSEAQVIRPRYLCNPVQKNHTPIVDPDLHYMCFEIIQNVEPALPDVHTSNQFGRQLVRPIQTELLCLPSTKTHL